MPDLAPGSSWGPFRIDSVLGRGPSGVVYRAARPDEPRVSLKIFNEEVDEPTLRRIEDDTRRLIGLSHPNIARVLSVGREGARLHVVSELFEGRSLRVIGSRSRRDLAEALLKSARAMGAAWMRLLLHRNLKPENILVSVGGEVKLVDFGQFRDATPYWAPERKTSQNTDLRGDLYSLGTIFREIIPDGDPELDALLQKMTRTETFERVQMVEDVISQLESWMSKQPAAAPVPAAPPPPVPPPPLVEPSVAPLSPPPPMPDPALDSVRSEIVRTLDAVSQRPASIPVPPSLPSMEPKWELPSVAPPTIPAPPPPVLEPRWELEAPPKPKEPPAAPPPKAKSWPPTPDTLPSPQPQPTPRREERRKPSGVWAVMKLLFWAAVVITAFAVRFINKMEKDRREAGQSSETRPSEKSRESKKSPVTKARTADWENTRTIVLNLDADLKAADALNELEKYISRSGDAVHPEAAEMRKSLKDWVSTVSHAESLRKYGADKQAADFLRKGGTSRPKQVDAILARWCEEDWTKTKAALDKAAGDNNTYAATMEIDRFLQKPHGGGRHRSDAEARKLMIQADIDYADVADRVENLRARTPADAVTSLEAFLAKPHQGGSHRDDVQKQIAALKSEAKLLIYSGRLSVPRMAASPSGARAAFAVEGVRIVDVASHDEVWTAPTKSLLRGLAFAGENRLITGLSNKVIAWDIPGKKELRSFTPPANVFFVAFAVKPDERTVVAAMSDGSLMIWDCDKDDAPTFIKQSTTGAVTIALNADGTRVAVASRDKSMRVRSLADGEEQKWQGPPVTVMALALSPDSKKVLAGSSNGAVTLWTAETGESGPSVTGHMGNVTCAAWSPDGATFATGGADYEIRLSSAKDGALLRVLTGHKGRISSIAFVPGGLISSSSDGTVRLWPLP